MGYSKQTWTDGPAGATPLSAARLSKMEDGIAAAAVLAEVGDPATATGAAISAASVAAVEAEPTVEPTGAWNFTQAPTVAGAPIGSAATAYRRVAIWNGSNYVVNGVTVTSGNRVATTFYSFLGGPDPNALGLMVDGDEWKDAT